ncbi:mitochondrial dicarboxylate/tricarboxylate transporter DTC-like isoform X2 [Rhodamnia argentea]|uniref:Mitochondrial dicarboxylate/tricarboxylate transporter DTC-like isoform X2 n=1 Tax=Rhodamnia argentea TaxID=178133 RepID=A0A8B8Q6S5_9MYRT|nr:mitochondrial dicarboxylate/tricarboxylate transporter DTC-like isoform X2 [Rhodamnia argentea]
MEDSHSHSVSNGRSGASSWWRAVKPFANGGMARVLQALLHEMIARHHPAKINLDKVPGRMILASLPDAVMFGSYETLRRKATSANGGVPLLFYQEAACGILAATSASLVFIPRFEIEKLIVADAALPAVQRVNYKSAGHAISWIVAKKGISGLWKSQYRVTLCTLHFTTFLLSYNQSFCYFKDSVRFDESCARLGASVVSGLATPICCTPFRNFVGFMQSIKSQAVQRPRPISSIDCALNMLKFGGHFKFFTGLSGYLLAWSPFLMTMSVFRDKLQEMEELNGW